MTETLNRFQSLIDFLSQKSKPTISELNTFLAFLIDTFASFSDQDIFDPYTEGYTFYFFDFIPEYGDIRLFPTYLLWRRYYKQPVLAIHVPYLKSTFGRLIQRVFNGFGIKCNGAFHQTIEKVEVINKLGRLT